MVARKRVGRKSVEAIIHDDKRANLPTADAHDFVSTEVEESIELLYPRDPSLDPQLVWKGKDQLDEFDLAVEAPPIYIQEKIDPRAIVENIRRSSDSSNPDPELLLFESFDGLDSLSLVEFYEHEANWSNRMVLGDSLQTMASLAEREALRGKVQTIYIDPPYGIKFRSNWQQTVGSREVRDGRLEDVVREVEQLRAFRDTWELGIHSYLTYLRDRIQVCRDLLTESGSVFVQIGDDNVHLVRGLLDEIFGRDNFVSQIAVTKSGGGLESVNRVPSRLDYLLWYSKNVEQMKYRPLFEEKQDLQAGGYSNLMLQSGEIRQLSADEKAGRISIPDGARVFRTESLTKPGPGSRYSIEWQGRTYDCGRRWWGNPKEAVEKLLHIGRVRPFGNTLRYIRFLEDFPNNRLSNLWDGLGGAVNPLYVVQTNTKVVERCILMTSDAGDLILDPTCGSGTTAFVAEQWGRRWITIDTSRVALALARSRLMGAKYPYYLLADSEEGREKESELSSTVLPRTITQGDIRQGFVCDRVPRITLSLIANNPDIDASSSTSDVGNAIRRHAKFETLFDKPFQDRRKIRVAGPFTVESLAPHRSISFSETMERPSSIDSRIGESFEHIVLNNLLVAGIQNGRRPERLELDSVDAYAGEYLQAIGVADSSIRPDAKPTRVGISIGPQYGTIGPSYIKEAAREAIRDETIDLLCVLGFSFDPSAVGSIDENIVSSDIGFDVAAERKLGRVPVLLVRMNTDLAMGDVLEKTTSANLFTVFGEPDLDVRDTNGQLEVEVLGVDVYDPTTGEIRSTDSGRIALWMIDTNYDGESFFVRHCYFAGTNDPFKQLRAALRSEIDESAWEALFRTVSLPFQIPETGRIAVKVINEYGDEVMKVVKV